jgi:hypothetical protein
MTALLSIVVLGTVALALALDFAVLIWLARRAASATGLSRFTLIQKSPKTFKTERAGLS